MAKIVWKGGTFEYPIPAALITCGTMEKSNVMTVAWTGIVNTKPPMVYVSIRPERYSYQMIKETGEFAINLTTQKLAYATDWCGVKSGSKVDKFQVMHLTKEKANFIQCPILKESPVSLECKVVEIKELGSHTMFLAEVLSIDPEEQYINEKGEFDIAKCDLIAYANGGYYTLGRKIGKFRLFCSEEKKVRRFLEIVF